MNIREKYFPQGSQIWISGKNIFPQGSQYESERLAFAIATQNIIGCTDSKAHDDTNNKIYQT